MDLLELQRQVVDRAIRAPWKVAQAPVRAAQLATAELGEREFDVALERPNFRLRRYEPEPETARHVPVVFTYPFINDPSILDFRPERSVIGGLLDGGFPGYVFEWKDASRIERSLTLGDYVDRFLGECVDVARGEAGADGVHLLGYSTGAPIAASFAALRPDAVRSLVLLGPPLDFEAGDAVEALRIQAENQDLDQLADTLDVVPSQAIEAVLLGRKPVELGVTNPLRLWDQLDSDEYVEDVGRKLDWLAGGPILPETMVRQFLEDLVIGNRLIRNELRLNGSRVDLERVDMPVCLFLGTEDEYVPRNASVPFLDAIASEDTTVIEVPTGHVGLSAAPEAHEEGWPRVGEWLVERS